jgi:hypothetical protein
LFELGAELFSDMGERIAAVIERFEIGWIAENDEAAHTRLDVDQRHQRIVRGIDPIAEPGEFGPAASEGREPRALVRPSAEPPGGAGGDREGPALPRDRRVHGQLGAQRGDAADALTLLILTATRTSEIIGAS